jgi:E3 ubiquitin-protein ligase DOA10
MAPTWWRNKGGRGSSCSLDFRHGLWYREREEKKEKERERGKEAAIVDMKHERHRCRGRKSEEKNRVVNNKSTNNSTCKRNGRSVRKEKKKEKR